jgi:hypothetical protein
MTIGGSYRGALWLRRVLLDTVWRPVRGVATGIITPIRFGVATGHWKSSVARAARSADGSLTPWYTYPATPIRPSISCGNAIFATATSWSSGGQSTLWWSARAHSVLTIEENAEWVARLRPQIGSNVSLHSVPVEPAAQSLQRISGLLEGSKVGKFDVIVVDGHLRRELAAIAFDYLAPDGALILDNTEGYGFHEEIADRSCRRVDFFGFAPGVVLRHCTSLVFVGDCFLLHPDIPIPVIEDA